MRADIQTDFLVIGTGAAGSVIGYDLARAKERTVMLERGKWVRPEDMVQNELAMIASIYKDGGAQMNTACDMFLLQGNCVGGSTVLTNAVCFRMPEAVRQEWAAFGFELDPDVMEGHYQRVESVLNVDSLDARLENPATPLLRKGLKAVGLEPQSFRKNYLRCIGCGYCNVGCMYGRKLDASMTWVPMAQNHGAEIVTEAEAIRIESRGGVAESVLCQDLRDGSTFRIRAKRIVLSGGAINTPELLLKSRILPKLSGSRASFNCGAIMFAEYEQDVDGFNGDQMGVFHLGDGYAIEQLHNPPASFALTMPGWYERHHQDLARYRKLTSAGVLVPTQPVGCVFLGIGRKLARPLFDHAEIEFQIPESDLCNMREGFKALARAYLASGAKRVIPPAYEYTEITSPDQVDVIDRVMKKQKDITGFGSSHPHGGACLGNDSRRDVVRPDFRVQGFDNLFVCDASLFPTSMRVNPQVPIMAIADYAVRSIGGFTPTGPIEEGPAWEAKQRGELANAAIE